MIIRAIAKLIVQEVGAPKAVLGTTLQFGWRPDNAPDDCHLVSEPSPGGETFFFLPDREDKLIQILTRAITYGTAEGNAKEIFLAINGTAGWQMPETVGEQKYEAQTVEAVEPPQYVGKDNKGRFEFSVDYIFKIVNRP